MGGAYDICFHFIFKYFGRVDLRIKSLVLNKHCAVYIQAQKLSKNVLRPQFVFLWTGVRFEILQIHQIYSVKATRILQRS